MGADAAPLAALLLFNVFVPLLVSILLVVWFMRSQEERVISLNQSPFQHVLLSRAGPAEAHLVTRIEELGHSSMKISHPSATLYQTTRKLSQDSFER